jgi:methionyl-tRNA formyltransferase
VRAVFLGTPAAAVPALEALHRVADITAVVTRTDKPRGRSQRPAPPPVKQAAERLGLVVVQPDGLDEISGHLDDADVAVLVAFGRLIPEDLLRRPKSGFVNVHFSLLPRWRGASPVERSILAGDEIAGVTVIQMDAGVDTGPIYATADTAIDPHETAGELTERLAHIGAALLSDTIAAVVEGELVAVEQDHSRATAAARIRVEEAFIDPRRHSGDAILRAVRAFNPRPGAWAMVDGDRFKLLRAQAAPETTLEPAVVSLDGGRVLLGVPGGAVELLEVQPSGAPAMSARDWMNGRRGVSAELTGPS